MWYLAYSRYRVCGQSAYTHALASVLLYGAEDGKQKTLVKESGDWREGWGRVSP